MARALVLLVGNNPLPNWVSWEYLRESGDVFDRVALLCSSESEMWSGTQAVAGRLRDEIYADCEERGLNRDMPLVLPIDDPSDERQIRRIAGKAVEACDEVHLNYTGGTKTMAVHTFEKCLQARSDGFTHSYLDPRRFRMWTNGRPGDRDVRTVVAVDYRRLLRLHDIEIAIEPVKAPLWPDTAEALRKCWIAAPRSVAAWRKALPDDPTWKEKGKRSWREARVRKARETNVGWPVAVGREGRNPRLRAQLEELAQELGQAFRENTGVDFQGGLDLRDRKRVTDDVALQAWEYFNGKWMESLILQVVKSAAPDLRAYRNLEGRRRREGGARVRKFELDVFVIKGYQLFAFSCTTSNTSSYLKNHAFEVMHRAAQLGGEEARAVLATFLPTEAQGDFPSVADLTEDMRTDLGGALSVRVTGREDWRDPILTMKDILEV